MIDVKEADAARQLDPGSRGAAARRCCAAASATARCWRRPCWRTSAVDTKLYREEAFGPVAILSKFSDFDDALDEVNDCKFGLQAGIFTRDLFQVLDAWDRLEVGGVVINDVPSYRVDNMPYGGVKDSGLGREGVRFAMEDMTEIRNLVIRSRG